VHANSSKVQPFCNIQLSFEAEDFVQEHRVQLLVGVVDTELLQPVELKSLASKNIQNSERIAIGRIWDGTICEALVAEILSSGSGSCL
jgi:hypothetical protein